MTETYTAIPNPGGRVNRAINAHAQATPSQAHIDSWHAEQPPAPALSTPVPVSVERLANADTAVYRTLILTANNATATPAGWYMQILPQDPDRRRALILAIDNDVILCDTKELAQSPQNIVATPPQPQGFYLSKGVVLELESRGLCFVVNTATSNTRVSVVIERYFRER